MQNILEQVEQIYSDFRSSERFDPEWLSNLRDQAYQQLKQINFPKPKDELWKYTSIRDLLNQPFKTPNPLFF